MILFPHMVTAGGALNYTLRLAEHLLAQGSDVAILTLRANLHTSVLPEGLEVVTIDGPLTSSLRYWIFLPFWQSKINKAIFAWQPDVLIPQVFPANWWGWLHKRRNPGMKLVWICHEPSAFIHSLPWIRAIRPWWKSLLARVLQPVLSAVDIALSRQSDRMVANSHFTAREMQRIYGVAPDGIACPGIDYQAFAGDYPQKERAIITVARLTLFKRVDFLLEVFSGLLNKHPDLTYHIIGSGEDECLLRTHAARLGLESQVVFHGSVDGQSLADLYRRSSLFLHGGVKEPFGMAPLEAIAYGTPVVAHRSGGPQEFVNDRCGRLISSLEVDDWVIKISEYLDFLFLEESSPERVRECARGYDWQHSLKPALEIIGDLCAEVSERTGIFNAT